MTIKFLKVKCGDSIVINFKDKKNIARNLIIDTGHHRKKIYPNFLLEVNKIFDRNEKIDLLILTHRDDDHIGGLCKLLNSNRFHLESNIEKVWLNHSVELSSSGSAISIGNAVDLKEILVASGKCPSSPVITETKTYDFYGATLTIISPDRKSYEREAKNFKKEELDRKISKRKSDHSNTISTLENKMVNFKEDNSIANRSSIAFVLEYQSKRGLFLADAHSSVIVDSLKKMGYSKDKKLKSDFIKVSHHGSKFSTSPEFLSMVDCQHFIFSTNGKNGFNLPDKETIVRIIKNPERNPGKKIYIYFNQRDEILEGIFDVDENPFNDNNFEVIFPKENELLTINF